MMASETSFVIEHPDKSRDVNAIYFAGVDGALDSYQAIRKKMRSTTSHIWTNCCRCADKES
jgi:hypothetical protein